MMTKANETWTCPGCGKDVPVNELYLARCQGVWRCEECVDRASAFVGPVSRQALADVADKIGLNGKGD